MSTQNQINLKDKSTVELKAIAFDLKNVLDQYSQMFQFVTQEISARLQAEQAVVPAPEASESVAEAPAKKASNKLKKA